MRIFKAEIKEMKDDGRSSGAGTSVKPPPEPLEGRVVDGEPGRASTPSEHRNDL